MRTWVDNGWSRRNEAADGGKIGLMRAVNEMLEPYLRGASSNRSHGIAGLVGIGYNADERLGMEAESGLHRRLTQCALVSALWVTLSTDPASLPDAQ